MKRFGTVAGMAGLLTAAIVASGAQMQDHSMHMGANALRQVLQPRYSAVTRR